MLSSTSRAASRALRSRTAQPAIQSLTKRSYHENIVEHYENPRNVGSLDKNESNVGTVRIKFRVFWDGFFLIVADDLVCLWRAQDLQQTHTFGDVSQNRYLKKKSRTK